jgi:hypothetical protein
LKGIEYFCAIEDKAKSLSLKPLIFPTVQSEGPVEHGKVYWSVQKSRWKKKAKMVGVFS